MKAVILAGGLGMRLRPFTEIIPKPLLPLGEKALLEVQVEHLKKYGFTDIYIATNYKSDFIKAYLGDGEKYGVNITYSEEKIRLGTCGPLSLLENTLNEPFLVINGDILSKSNYKGLYEYAVKNSESDITIVTKVILTPFRFGKITSKDNYVIDIEEKPDIEIEILAGIYVMKPGIFKHIPQDTYFGMDDLLKNMITEGQKIQKFQLEDYWIDIGQIGDYKEAVDIYKKHFED